MKRLVSLLIGVLAVLFLFAACKGAGETTKESLESETESGETSAEETTAEETTAEETQVEQILTVHDGKILSQNGEEVVLKGINLGGWLLQETWMCAVLGSESNSESFAVLKQRGFSEEEIKTLFTSYADHYITENDIKNIHSLGLNCLRIPFWYRNFMTEELAFYSEDPEENPGFHYLDRVIGWAKKYGIYVVLDMHGAPGGQSTDHSCGIIGKNQLYTEEKNLAAMERLWVAIAERYRDDPTVAAYDVMNEPMNNDSSYENGWAAGSEEAIRHTLAVYRRMIAAIRGVDSRHIITIEGIWSMEYLPDPQKEGWTNMMYQLHLYDSTRDMIDYRVAEMVKARDTYGVAIYIGEYNNGDENQEYAYLQYESEKISRTAWTYKTAKGNQGNWSLYYSSTPAADLTKDSYEEILEKWGHCLLTTSSSWTRNNTLRRWLMRYN